MKQEWDLHGVLSRPLKREPVIMHWKHDGKIGCAIPVGDCVTSMKCDAFHYLTLKYNYCSPCAEAARKVLDSESVK